MRLKYHAIIHSAANYTSAAQPNLLEGSHSWRISECAPEILKILNPRWLRGSCTSGQCKWLVLLSGGDHGEGDPVVGFKPCSAQRRHPPRWDTERRHGVTESRTGSTGQNQHKNPLCNHNQSMLLMFLPGKARRVGWVRAVKRDDPVVSLRGEPDTPGWAERSSEDLGHSRVGQTPSIWWGCACCSEGALPAVVCSAGSGQRVEGPCPTPIPPQWKFHSALSQLHPHPSTSPTSFAISVVLWCFFLVLAHLPCPRFWLGCLNVEGTAVATAYYLQNSSLNSFYKYYMQLQKNLGWCLLTSVYFSGDHRVCCYFARPWKEESAFWWNPVPIKTQLETDEYFIMNNMYKAIHLFSMHSVPFSQVTSLFKLFIEKQV